MYGLSIKNLFISSITSLNGVRAFQSFTFADYHPRTTIRALPSAHYHPRAYFHWSTESVHHAMP